MGNPFKGKAIPKPIMIRAIEMNHSMSSAAASIHVSYQTFKKYALIYDIWAPLKDPVIAVSVKKTRMKHWYGKKQLGMEKNNELMRSLILEGYKDQRCDFCGYNHYRESDLLSPLMVTFDNLDENDHTPNNVKFYCYNCYFSLYDVKFKPTTVKLSARKIGEPIKNHLTKQLDDKLEEINKAEDDAKALGNKISAIFKRA